MEINFILIGKRINEVRHGKKISQADLAERAGLSVSFISYIETAVKQASLTSLVNIANGLSVTVDSLLNGNHKEDPAEYVSEVNQLLSDCNGYEKRVIFDAAYAVKRSLRENRWLNRKSESN